MSATGGLVARAQDLIRAGALDEGIKLLNDALAQRLDESDRHRAHTLLGLAFFFGGRFPEAFSWFTVAAEGSEEVLLRRSAQECRGVPGPRTRPPTATGFLYTTHRVTDTSFWGLRGVPSYYEVLPLILEYYRGLGKAEAEWIRWCDEVARVDQEGQEFAEQLKAQWSTIAEP